MTWRSKGTGWAIGCERKSRCWRERVKDRPGQYRRLTEFGDDAHWLSDGRRLLVGDSSSGRISLVDAASGKSVPVLDALRLRPGERSGSGIGVFRAKFGVSRDDRTIFTVRDHSEADIWQIELEGSAAGK